MAELGEKLGEGDLSDQGVDQLQIALNNILSLSPEDFATKKAKNKQTWLDEAATRLNPEQNPAGFRMCQDATIARGAIGTFLGLARLGPNDRMKQRSCEVLARVAFGNETGATAVALDAEFMPTLQTLLTEGQQPEILIAMQLAQAVAASPASDVVPVVPSIAAAVAPQLDNRDFRILPQAALDVLVSCSFTDPTSVIAVISWPRLATWFSDDAKPHFLDDDDLTVFLTGLLATNVLEEPMPELEADAQARAMVVQSLESGRFLEFICTAMQAAVERREWPPQSCAYHNPKRLTRTVLSLANLGYKRVLVGAIPSLVVGVESSIDDLSTKLALRALRRLCDDMVCLDCLLPMEEFRNETLDNMHRDADEPDAAELASHLETVEQGLTAAKELYERAAPLSKHMPPVQELAAIFNDYVPMDAEMEEEQLLAACRRIPVGPEKSVKVSLGSTKHWSFAVFALNVYGSATVIGWWPSLMQDLCDWWKKLEAEAVPRLPSLQDWMALWELGSKGQSTIQSLVIMEEMLPAAGLPVEGDAVEELFAEIRGDTPLNIKAFAEWFGRLLKDLAKEDAAAAAAAAAQAAEAGEPPAEEPPAGEPPADA